VAVYEFPTSFGQRRMWLLAEMDQVSHLQHCWALWLDGALEVSALQQAWDAALIRHEALRTTFATPLACRYRFIDDEPAPQPLLVTSVEQLPAGERERAAWTISAGSPGSPSTSPSGLSPAPPWWRLSPEAHVLAVVMHHIVADGCPSGSCSMSCQRTTSHQQAAAATRWPPNRRSSTPTSPSGRSSTPSRRVRARRPVLAGRAGRASVDAATAGG